MTRIHREPAANPAMLLEAADLIREIRELDRRLQAPCGRPCDCPRVVHAGNVLQPKAKRPARIPRDPLGDRCRRSLTEAHADLVHYSQHPEFLEQLRTIRQAVFNIALLISYAEGIEHVHGDLPVVAAKQGTPRNQGSFTENAGTFVYVAYDDHDEVIYVGVTDDLFGRMSGHRGSKRWWPNMARLEWEEWPDREAALRKESILIRRYRPKFNIVGNPDARKGGG